MAPKGLELEIVSLESGALLACPFPAGTLLYVVQCIYLCIELTQWRRVNFVLGGLKNNNINYHK